MKFKVILASLSLFVIGCKTETPPTEPNEPTPISLGLEFYHSFDGQPFAMNQWYLTSPGDSFKFSRLDYLMSNVYLIKENGDTLFAEGRNNFGLVKANEGMGSWEFGEILTGKYQGLGFDLGLEDYINKSNPNQWGAGHPLNPVVNSLHWGWADGYVFTALEGRYLDSTSAEVLVLLHIAFEKNRRSIYLNQPFELTGNSTIELDYAVDRLFNAVNEYRPERDGTFTHSADTDGGLSTLMSENIAASLSIQNVRTE